MYVSQASSLFHVVQATSAKFRVFTGSIKYCTKNEEQIRIHTITHKILLVFFAIHNMQQQH